MTTFVLVHGAWGGSHGFRTVRGPHLVYLDAFKPADGQSLDDLATAGYGKGAVGPGGEWLVPTMARALRNADEASWYTARRSPHPVGCFIERARLARPLEEYPFTRTYIKATEEPRPVDGGRPAPFWAAADHAKTSQDWRYREIDTGHMILANRPAELVSLLLELT